MHQLREIMLVKGNRMQSSISTSSDVVNNFTSGLKLQPQSAIIHNIFLDWRPAINIHDCDAMKLLNSPPQELSLRPSAILAISLAIATGAALQGDHHAACAAIVAVLVEVDALRIAPAKRQPGFIAHSPD